ncbi:MAG TPA: hypothetical protein VNZ64_05655 [Candidatus Acidoferrum sp.]|nr:hypothetical protein [Candidatus Acidoferrum sp.]
MRVAERVLAELRWREEGLLQKNVEPERLTALIHSLARDCRSQAPDSTLALVSTMSGLSRRKMYQVVLAIVEDLPTRLPSLHTIERLPKGGCYNGGWPDWHRERVLTKEFHEDVLLGRSLTSSCMAARLHRGNRV